MLDVIIFNPYLVGLNIHLNILIFIPQLLDILGLKDTTFLVDSHTLQYSIEPAIFSYLYMELLHLVFGNGLSTSTR